MKVKVPTRQEVEFRSNAVTDSCVYYELRWVEKNRRVGMVKATIFDGAADLGDMFIDDLKAQQEQRLSQLRHAGIWRNLKQYFGLKFHPPSGLHLNDLDSFLLEKTLSDLRARGCKRAFGRVVHNDDQQHPRPLKWYREFGFAVQPRRGGYEIDIQL